MRVSQQNTLAFELSSEAGSEAILIIDEDHIIVSINKRGVELFGYSEKELLGKPLGLLIPGDEEDTGKQGFDELIFGKNRLPKDHWVENLTGYTKTGLEIALHVQLNTFQIQDKDYFLLLLSDLTEKRDLLKTLHIHHLALDAALNGITITDARKKDNPIIYVNKAFERITGYTKKEILNTNCRFLQNDDTDQIGVRVMSRAISRGKSCRVQIRNYRKNGELFWNEVYMNPIRDEKGEVTHFVGIQNDITKRKLTEDENRQLIRIFNESDNEIYVYNARTLRFKHVNLGARKNTGYSLKELMYMRPFDLKTNFTEEQFRKLIAPLLGAPGKKLTFESVQRRKDGSTYPVEVHLESSKVGANCYIGAVILDISDRRDYTQRLERTVAERTSQLQKALSREKELNELKSKFLSLVSHEFKTPLSGILTSATLVGKYTTSDTQDKREKHLNSIVAGVHYLTGILNDFLSIEHLEKGEPLYKMTQFSLSKVINEVLYNANMTLKSGQHIQYPMNIDEVVVCQDEKIVQLALTNLLNNSIKYSPENSEIQLKVELTGNRIVFEVIDQGIGIPEQDQKHVFERYFRAGNILTTQGTGIGLNIVKTHVDNLGGELSFKSKENQGSTFRLILPNEPEECLKKVKK